MVSSLDGGLPAKLPTLNTEQMRQSLAGLIDVQASSVGSDANYDRLAIQFCAVLPRIFGDELERVTLWNRIGSAIQSAFAKVINSDVDLFVQHVCEHIRADVAAAVSDEGLFLVLEALHQLSAKERQDWMIYLKTHLIPVLVHARAVWKASMDAKKASKEEVAK